MKRLNCKNILLLLACIIMFGMILWFEIGAQPVNVAFNNEEAYTIDGEFQVTVGDETVTVNAPAKVEAELEDTVTITKILEKEDIKGNSVMFYVRQSYVNVYIGDEQCIRDTSDRKMPYYMTPGSYWYCTRLPDDWEGKELRIEIKADVERYAGEIPAVYTGNKNAFVYMTIENAIYSMLLCVPILVFGLALVAFGVFTAKNKLKDRMILLGLFAIATSVWNLLEARMTQVFFRDVRLATVVLFSCYYIIPFLAACFLDTYDSFRKNKFMRVTMYGTGITYVLLQVLQGLSIIRYIDFVSLGHIMIALVIVGVAVNYVIQIRRSKKVADVVVYKAIIILGIFCFVDMFRYHLSPMLRATQFSIIGFLVFFVYLGFSVINQMNEASIREHENEIYKKLAFIDKMTQIKNRTAFEQKMYTMGQSDVPESTYFYMVDMNNLKYINDHYGHSAGDYAIIEIAKALEKCFGDAECYRIGGDEFCVIAEGISEEMIKECSEKIYEELKEKSKDKEYDIVIAVGYSKVDESGINECFNKADAMMYQNKALLKNR